MERLLGNPEVPYAAGYSGIGKTALELLAQPVEARGSGPEPTPPTPIETAPKQTSPDHTGYPDVSPPDQEYLYE
jgi:hypothetical protein